MTTIQAYVLSDAIRASDIAAVEDITQQETLNDFSDYAALAQEVLDMRRKNLEQGQWLCQIHMSPTASYVPGTMPHFIGMACAGVGFMSARYDRTLFYSYRTLLHVSSLVAFCVIKKMKDYKELDYLQTMYENAWDINELL